MLHRLGASGALCSHTVFCRESGTRSSALWIITRSAVDETARGGYAATAALWPRAEKSQINRVRGPSTRRAHPRKQNRYEEGWDKGERTQRTAQPVFRRFASGPHGERRAPRFADVEGSSSSSIQPPASMPSRRRRATFRRRSSAMTSGQFRMPTWYDLPCGLSKV